MNLKTILIVAILLMGFCSLSYGQHSFADTTETSGERLSHPASVALGGEVLFTTYGMAASFPTFWIEPRIKVVLLAGLFWKDFYADGFDLNPALGIKALFYFRRQARGPNPANSFYAGAGGMSSKVGIFDSDINQRTRSALILGHTFLVKPAVQLAPELHLGANADGAFRFGVGLVIHFGR